MRHLDQSLKSELRYETAETLFLMAVLGGADLREAAIKELDRRNALIEYQEFENSCITNLSGIC